MLSRRRRT
jgi:hypothetical protein